MSAPTCPYREIRAHYIEDRITLYQAYNKEIGTAAVEQQRLDASSKFSITRMTWVKPSWAWMLYRSGYSFKDVGQECILALSVQKDVFIALLEAAIAPTTHATDQAHTMGKEGPPRVRVQWDPERTIRLEKLPYRSIQLGIPGALVQQLMLGIVAIEDVTEQARALKKILDESSDVEMKDLLEQGLILEEKTFPVSEELAHLLGMIERKPA